MRTEKCRTQNTRCGFYNFDEAIDFTSCINLGSLRLCASAVGFLLFLLASAQELFPPRDCFAAVQPQAPAVTPGELDRSVDEALSRREYTWKMPQEKRPGPEDNGTFSAFIKAVSDTLSYWLKPVGRWILKALRWILDQLRNIHIGEKSPPPDAGWMKSMQALLYVVLCAAAGLLALMLFRVWKRRRVANVTVAIEEAKVPDITDDNIMADELPADRWLNLAGELMEQGDLRLALRALYLACLSHLSAHEMITIARFKSDMDYERELLRKAHNARPETIPAFSENMRIFERIWYGMHEITDEVFGKFSENQNRIMAEGAGQTGPLK